MDCKNEGKKQKQKQTGYSEHYQLLLSINSLLAEE